MGPTHVGQAAAGRQDARHRRLPREGKPQSLVCEGSNDAINLALRQLPEHERRLVVAALDRIRMLNSEKPAKSEDKKR